MTCGGHKLRHDLMYMNVFLIRGITGTSGQLRLLLDWTVKQDGTRTGT